MCVVRMYVTTRSGSPRDARDAATPRGWHNFWPPRPSASPTPGRHAPPADAPPRPIVPPPLCPVCAAACSFSCGGARACVSLRPCARSSRGGARAGVLVRPLVQARASAKDVRGARPWGGRARHLFHYHSHSLMSLKPFRSSLAPATGKLRRPFH